MKKTIKEIIKDAIDSFIPMYEYVQRLPMNEFSLTPELLDEINTIRESKDDSLLEYVLIIASRDGLDTRYTRVLCELLKEDWHYSHEDIVMMLEEIKDPTSISCLYETSFEVQNYDDGKSLAKKCIWALGAINTPEAREKLVLLKNTNDPIVREVATMQLHHNVN